MLCMNVAAHVPENSRCDCIVTGWPSIRDPAGCRTHTTGPGWCVRDNRPIVRPLCLTRQRLSDSLVAVGNYTLQGCDITGAN